MTFELTQNHLIKYLQEHKLDPTLQKETDQVYIVMKIGGFDIPIFFGIRTESTILQLIAYLPYQIQEDAVGDIARVLHLLNRELDLPGFGMDEEQRLMFYRSVIPCLDKKVDENLLNMYLGTTRVACDTFLQAIGMIASGSAKVDDIIKQRKKGHE